MTNLLQSVGDDQTVIGASAIALTLSALFVFASFHLGPAGQKLRNRNRKTSGTIVDTQTSFDPDQSRERAA